MQTKMLTMKGQIGWWIGYSHAFIHDEEANAFSHVT
jgi:hypothetical protein